MKILIPVDGSRFSKAALRFVASRTTLIGSRPQVELLNVQLPIPRAAVEMAGRANARAFHEAEAKQVLLPAAATLERAGLRVRTQYRVGSPAATVAKRAAAGKADLIVMGSHGHGALKGLLFGSVTTAVLASCATPLLIVRGSSAPAADSMKIGIAVDGSRYGLAAVRYALKHRDLFGAAPQIALIHVVPDFFSTVIPGLAEAPVPIYRPDDIAAVQDQAFEAALAPVRKRLRPSGPRGLSGMRVAEERLTGNNAGSEIAAYAARKKLDLLIMGSHGHGAFKSVVLGSVAMRVAAQCRTPLLLTRAT